MLMKPPFPAGTIENFFPKTPYFFLSNFYPASVEYEGVTYMTVEHAYQAAKTEDPSIRMVVAACGSAAAAKKQGNAIALRPGWDQIKFDIMRELIDKKFPCDDPNNALSKMLYETGWDTELIEGNYWHDLVWGQCFCPRHNWDGANRLGGILMNRRIDIFMRWKYGFGITMENFHESEHASPSTGDNQ